jgi:hypothetical protein
VTRVVQIFYVLVWCAAGRELHGHQGADIQLVLISRNGLSGMLVLDGITCLFTENNVWLYFFVCILAYASVVCIFDVKVNGEIWHAKWRSEHLIGYVSSMKSGKPTLLALRMSSSTMKLS